MMRRSDILLRKHECLDALDRLGRKVIGLDIGNDYNTVCDFVEEITTDLDKKHLRILKVIQTMESYGDEEPWCSLAKLLRRCLEDDKMGV